MELERRERFGGVDVFFRPMKPSDEKRLQDLFHSQSAETTLRRYGIPLKTLGTRQLRELVCVDYRTDMAIAGFVKEGGREKMICVGRCCGAKGSKTAEAAFTVRDDYQRKGIGSFLIGYLARLGLERGLTAFTAEVSAGNTAMLRAFESRFEGVKTRELGPDGVSLLLPLAALRPVRP